MSINSEFKVSKKIKKIFILSGQNVIKKKNTILFINKFFKKDDKEIKIYVKKNFLPDIKELTKIVHEIKSYKPDLIVAIGGGGIIDYSKIANGVIHIKKIDSILKKKVKFKKFTKLLTVPTTAGSGAEVTPGAVLYKNKIKYNLKDKCLIPDNYLLYPPLIVGTHRELKASSIFDSLSQSIESLISLKSNKISQRNSLNSISLILKNYKNFLRKNEYKTIKNMQIAANFSGKAISVTSTGAPHALSYYLSSNFGLYHGTSVMFFLPTILEYNFKNKNILKKIERKKFDHRIDLLKKVFGVKSDSKILEKIKSIIKYSKVSMSIKKKSIDIDRQKKSINLNRLENNPIPISYSEILKFNNKVFL